MNIKELVHQWFAMWGKGDYMNLLTSENFEHSNRIGIIKGREKHLLFVEDNKGKFLGNRFEFPDETYEQSRACVR